MLEKIFGKKEKEMTLQEKVQQLVTKSNEAQMTHDAAVNTFHKTVEDTHAAIELAKQATTKVLAAVGILTSHKIKAEEIHKKTNKELGE